MNRLIILGHQGLGDYIICFSLIKILAAKENSPVLVPCWCESIESVRWLFKETNVEIVHLPDEKSCEEFANRSEKSGGRVVRLGIYGEGYDNSNWSKGFYLQAGLNPELRWSEFSVKTPAEQMSVPSFPYSFVHDDAGRNMNIDFSKAGGLSLPKVYPRGENTVFSYMDLLEGAEEIHLIDSCFLCLADSLELKGNLIFHKYAKKDPNPPALKHDWRIV